MAALLWASLAATASAQEPPPADPEPPPPAATELTLRVEGTLRADGRRFALTGDRLLATGRMRPSAKGERVVVRFRRDGAQRHAERVTVRADGTFRAGWRSRKGGRVTVIAEHRRSDAFQAARSAPARVRVLDATLGAGSRGPLVRLYQRGLAKLRYAVSRSGRWDDATGRATMAYRKVNGMRRTYAASRAVVRRVLAGRGAFRPRYPDRDGRHVEADLSRQVLALVRDGRPFRVYHTSSGAPATPTVLGTYRVYRKDPGTNSLGMVHSSYFIRGYAIHGYASVPPYNASHGCLRVPVPDAWFIYRWVRMGDRVSVYP